MERRKILLGSGAALATVLAGCSSSETGDDDPDDDDEESFSNDNGNGDDNGDDHDDNGDDDDDQDDVPGVDGDLEVDSDKLTITSVERKDDTLDVVVRTETTDSDELRKELEAVGEDIGRVIADRDHFKAEIDTIEWILEHEGSRVLAVYIDVQWVLDYLDDELSAEEFAEKVYETKE